jgi:hypothetical protein
VLDPLNNLNTPCALALFLGSMDTTAKRLTRVRSYPYRLQFPVARLFIARAERQARPLPTITFARLIRPLEGHLSAPATGSRQPCPIARTRVRNRPPLR